MPPIASAAPVSVASRAVARANPFLRGRLPQRWHAGACSALALCLLAAAPLADAWHPQYPPWADTPPSAACPVVALQPADGRERAWDGATSYRHAGIRLQLDFTDMPALQLFDAHDRALTAPVALGGAQMGFHGVEAVDLNRDRRPDFIVTLGSGGVGLAGGNAWRRVLLSDGSGYRSIEVETHEPTADDYRVLPHRAGCGLLQLVPVWGDASSTRDRKPHLFWVYRMLRFERGRAAYADAQLPGLPKWILYTARPHNSRASGLLGPARKRQLWSAREHGRITPAPVDP